MAAIDIGAAAVNRSGVQSYGVTFATLDNPANGTGTITSIEVWCLLNLSDLKAGTFSGSGTDYTPNDSEVIGAITSGSKQTATGLTIDVASGEYIGAYWSAGLMDRESSSGAGYYYKVGDQFAAGEQTYVLLAGYIMSLYGTGGTAAVVTTQAATLVRATTVTGNGNITDDGDGNVTQHGICWKAGSDPVNIAGADDYTEEGAGSEGAFTSAETGLTGGTTYYYRAYATNSLGTYYGAAQSFKTTDIDIGGTAIDRDSNFGTGYTRIDLTNPANDTGAITSVELWFDTADGAGVVVGTFFGSSTDYTSRDSHTIGAVTKGSKQVFTGLDIDVTSGDYMGNYYTPTGAIERATSGGSGVYYLSGNQFGAGEQTYADGGSTAAMSCYGVGAAAVTSIKTLLGTPIAELATWNGEPIASYKTILGISNVD